MADLDKDGYDDADLNRDGITESPEQTEYDKNPSKYSPSLVQPQPQPSPSGTGTLMPSLAAPTGEPGASSGATTSDILWTGTTTSNPKFKSKTAVKNGYLTRTLEPSFLNRIDSYYNTYGKALGFKSASSFWNTIVDQSDTISSPWNELSKVKSAVEAGVTAAPGTGEGLSAAQVAARKELQQMNAALSQNPEADLVGEPGKFQETLTKYSDSMGLLKSRKEVNTYVKGIMEGKLAADAVTDDMRKQAEVLYANFSDRLRTNPSLTVRDLANPYLQVMADTLEIDPQLVKLTDPTIQNAISGTKLRSLTDFRTDMRADSRFATTRTAKREATDFAQSLLKGFGFSV